MFKLPTLLTLFVSLYLLILLFVGFAHPITAFSQDLGRHIFTGERILTQHEIPRTNLYSYTYPDFPFQNHHWLSEVVFFLVSFSGTTGFYVLLFFLVGLACGLQFLAARKHATLPALFLTGVLYLRILFERTDLRPELFSFLFLSLFSVILYTNRERPTRLIWLLIPLQLLWVNMHIYFAIGLLITGLFLIDELIRSRRELTSLRVRILSGVFLSCCLVSLLNPHGIDGVLYPLHVFDNYGYTIEENQTIFLLESLGIVKVSAQYFKITVLLFFISLLLHFRRTRVIDWLLAVVFSVLGFLAVRNLPLFVFATFIPFTFHFSALLTLLTKHLRPQIKTASWYLPALCITLLAIVFWQGSEVVKKHPVGLRVEAGAKPGVDFFLKEKLTGPIYNNFDIGSYLTHRLYPTERVFVDGRPEAYPKDFFLQTYIPMQESPALFQQVAKNYHLNTIFFSHTDQTPWGTTFLTQIVGNPEWHIVYLDETVIILLRDTPQNRSLIDSFGMTKESLRVTRTEHSLQGALQLASFFSKIGWVQEGIPYYQEILQFDPTHCQALAILTQVYQMQENILMNHFGQLYQKHCQ